ncbi:hypothetical protein [Nonomuraea gerenzanensis]|uniref:Uncharacterized protein n=1 Tax=Nonomuraea gerenzanensis TaxID=93944 RepID=A0A1M4EN95_9ACTN|nr:hypothetical protein [Nonomuraea gerenzanensis]UBU11804.1 hypothetical protein LCN96_47135 [Nonomuraea gerenzanensis]SBP00309.1 hypothetical protein BN4615_P9825 [Nonomuraea gerenzanensis]
MMPSYIAEEQRGAEARILNVLFPTILQGLQLTHQAADQFGARPQQAHMLPMRPRVEHRPVDYQQQQQQYATPETYAQLAADRSFMDVAAVLMPVVQAIIPPLVEQLLSFGPPKADTDQNEEERFLQFVPQLLGTVTPIMMQVLPGLLRGMHGMRAEHPVRITDRELNQRYFGPIVQATLPAIVSQLPELLAMVHGDQRSPVRYERMPGRGPIQLMRINRNDLVNAHRLRDGDVLHLTETPAQPGTTEIRITTAPHSMWWKGVQVTDETDRQLCFVEADGDRYASFESRAVQAGGAIVLWKARMFGEHTPMYLIPIGELSPDGKCFNFHWAAD